MNKKILLIGIFALLLIGGVCAYMQIRLHEDYLSQLSPQNQFLAKWYADSLNHDLQKGYSLEALYTREQLYNKLRGVNNGG